MGRAPGRYLQRVRARPDPAYGFGPETKIGAGRMVFPPGATFGPRKQAGYETVLVHEGGVVIDVDGTPLRLRPGEVTLLRPGPSCTFRFTRKEETSLSYVSSHDPALPSPLLAMLDAPPFTLPASEAMTRLVEMVLALRETPARPTKPRAALVALAMAVVALYVDEATERGMLGRNATRASEHPAATAAREFMRRRLSERIGLAEIAGAGHVAPEHLVRIFRQHLGTTPVRYLWAARVRLGIHLLEHSHLPVAEIAARVGCQSPKHFARLIRAEVGAPPREVRKRSWKAVLGEPIPAPEPAPAPLVQPPSQPGGPPPPAQAQLSPELTPSPVALVSSTHTGDDQAMATRPWTRSR
jgi:AraC-like DNA-binding protein